MCGRRGASSVRASMRHNAAGGSPKVRLSLGHWRVRACTMTARGRDTQGPRAVCVPACPAGPLQQKGSTCAFRGCGRRRAGDATRARPCAPVIAPLPRNPPLPRHPTRCVGPCAPAVSLVRNGCARACCARACCAAKWAQPWRAVVGAPSTVSAPLENIKFTFSKLRQRCPQKRWRRSGANACDVAARTHCQLLERGVPPGGREPPQHS